MLNNFDKDFFSKNNRIKLCSIVLTGMMVASPFIVKGMVNKAIDDLEHHNETTIVQEQNIQDEEEKSRIYVEYEGDFNLENGAIIIVNKDDINNDGKTEIVASITPNADEPYVDLPSGTYIISNYNDSYEIQLDGENDYSLTVDYQTGTITNNNEQEKSQSHTK